jgi:hypothetical protein
VRKFRILCLLGVVSAMSAIAATPAPAHDHCGAVHGNDYACVTDNHTRLHTCDMESDGNGVRSHWRDFALNVTVGNWDPDGAGGYCRIEVLPSSAVEFRVCENNVGCSGWVWE